MSIVAVIERVGVVFGALFFVFFPFELRARWKKRELTWPYVREMLASASPFVPTVLLGGATMAFIVALFNAASALAITRIDTTPLSALACLLVCDLLYYVDHRMGHRVRLYWAVSHSVHHSSPAYNQTTALRVSVVDGYTSPWFQVPAVLVGFDPLLVLACFGFIISYQQWIHTESIAKLRWLDGVFNTPSNHRVHHSSLPEHLDKNYGGFLIVWDRLFGTYAAETGPVVYGLTTPLASTNPIDVHIHDARKLWRDLGRTASLSERLKVLIRGPEYEPLSWRDAMPEPAQRCADLSLPVLDLLRIPSESACISVIDASPSSSAHTVITSVCASLAEAPPRGPRCLESRRPPRGAPRATLTHPRSA